MTRRHEFLQGARDILPLIVGAIPFGIIFGSLAASYGLSLGQALGMSLLVFAGSAQFIGVSLIGGGAGAAVVLLTTLVVNLRHALYSATLQPFVRHLPKRWRVPLAFWLTDEAFAVVQHRYAERDASPHKHWYFCGAALNDSGLSNGMALSPQVLNSILCMVQSVYYEAIKGLVIGEGILKRNVFLKSVIELGMGIQREIWALAEESVAAILP